MLNVLIIVGVFMQTIYFILLLGPPEQICPHSYILSNFLNISAHIFRFGLCIMCYIIFSIFARFLHLSTAGQIG